MKEVNHDVRFRGGRFALRKAANVIKDAAKINAAKINDPSTGRSIASNIQARWNGKLFKQTGNLGMRIGVRGNAILPKPGQDVYTGVGGRTPHWRLIEFGTSQMAARPFMRPAIDDNVAAATAEFIKQYGKALDRAIKRASDSGAK